MANRNISFQLLSILIDINNIKKMEKDATFRN